MPDQRHSKDGGDPWENHEDVTKNEPRDAPTRPLIARYLLGLGLIAVFAISSTYLVARALSRQDADIQPLLLQGILLVALVEGIFLFRPLARRIKQGRAEREEEHEAEREQDGEEINYLAQFDPLTGLANRVLLRDRLEHAVVRARRDGTLVSVMFIDLDDFKAVNDQLGHHIGDQLLRQVAGRLEDSVRESDTVARLGGDEFMIILEGGTRPEDAGQVAEKVLSALEKPFLLLDRKLFVTGSIGIVVYPLDGESIDGLLRDADLAMYSAKDAGKNTYQFVTAELRAKTSARIELLTSLRAALARDDQLWLAYQPKLWLETGQVTGVEALLRWDHPEMGAVMPGQFIPIAEDTDLILPLGEWVLTEACHQAREWMDSSLPNISVSVNVAARQFRHGDLVETVGRALRDSGVDPKLIELELTEGTLIEDTEMTRRTLERLKKMGVRISIDDFGTGYSSLSYLKQFPIDYLKIDRSFITDLEREPDSMAIPTAVIRLAHSLSLKVIAEGVETPEQHEILSELGCDIAQGYLFGKPVRPLEIEEIVRKGTAVKV
ncbi:MAG: putative bifunctional diguanylate cyclase/phosphodiesterase [Acidimicrobiia bacterium]